MLRSSITMICSKQDLREYIEADQNALGGGYN